MSFKTSITIALAINMVYFFAFLIWWFIGGYHFPYWQCRQDSNDYSDCSDKEVSLVKVFTIPLIVIYIPIFLLMISSLNFRTWIGTPVIGVSIIIGYAFILISAYMYLSIVANELPSWMCNNVSKKCNHYDTSLTKIVFITSYAYMVLIAVVYLIYKHKKGQ